MPIRAWRRLHGADLIAQVEPVPGFGTWTARAWVETDARNGIDGTRHFELLTSAQAMADHLTTLQSGECAAIRWRGLADSSRDRYACRWRRRSALQPNDAQPEHVRGYSLTAFPLVDHGLACSPDSCGEFPLTQAQTASEAHEDGRVVRRHDHATHRQPLTTAASICSAVPHGQEVCRRVSGGHRVVEQPPIVNPRRAASGHLERRRRMRIPFVRAPVVVSTTTCRPACEMSAAESPRSISSSHHRSPIPCVVAAIRGDRRSRRHGGTLRHRTRSQPLCEWRRNSHR